MKTGVVALIIAALHNGISSLSRACNILFSPATIINYTLFRKPLQMHVAFSPLFERTSLSVWQLGKSRLKQVRVVEITR